MPLPVPGRVAEALRRSTAYIRTAGTGAEGCGSGVVLTDDQVLTNAHVIRGNGLSIESWEGKSASGSLVKIDRRRDLALLRAPGLHAEPACLGDSARVKPGLPVVAVGNPLGFVGAISSGVVNAIGPVRPVSGLTWIHVDVRLAPGNSGGPLADFEGRVIGINTMVVSGGLALSIPSRAVQAFLARSTGQTRSLGVVVRPVKLRETGFGMMVLELVAGGAAEKGSLLPGDILVGGNGSRFRFFDDLELAIEEAPDALLHLDFYRNGQDKLRHVSVRLAPELARHAA